MSSKRNLILGLLVLIFLVVGAYVIYSTGNTSEPMDNNEDNVTPDQDQNNNDDQNTEQEEKPEKEEEHNNEPLPAPDETPEKQPEPQPQPQPEPEPVALAPLSYSLNMDNLSFSPNAITAKPGQTITVNVTSVAGTHNFIINELNASTSTVNTGGQSSVTFTIPENTAVGTTYEFYCGISNHRALGMVGTLTIVQ